MFINNIKRIIYVKFLFILNMISENIIIVIESVIRVVAKIQIKLLIVFKSLNRDITSPAVLFL